MTVRLYRSSIIEYMPLSALCITRRVFFLFLVYLPQVDAFFTPHYFFRLLFFILLRLEIAAVPELKRACKFERYRIQRCKR